MARTNKVRHNLAAAGILTLALGVWVVRADVFAPNTSVVYFEADYPQYDSLSEITADADVVAVVKVVGSPTAVELLPTPPRNPTDPVENPSYGAPASRMSEVETPPIVASEWSAQIVSAAKGHASKGDTITIRELGGVVDGVKYEREETGAASIARGESLVFLREVGPNSYVLLNPDQAMMVKGSDGHFAPEERVGIAADPMAIAELAGGAQ